MRATDCRSTHRQPRLWSASDARRRQPPSDGTGSRDGSRCAARSSITCGPEKSAALSRSRPILALQPEGANDVVATIQQIRDCTPPGSVEEGRLLARLGAAVYFETGDYQATQAAFARALGISAVEREAGLELRTLAYATSVDHFDLRWSEVLAKSRRIRELAQRVDDLHSETYARFRAAYALTHTGCTDEGILESDASLALAERLKDHGLLADALYVKNALAQLRGEWREARAHSDRALALSAHQLPFLLSRMFLEYETGNRKAGDGYLQRVLAAERLAGPPYPLAGVFAALALSQHTYLWNDSTRSDAALRAARGGVVEKTTSNPAGAGLSRISRGLVAVRRSRPDECEDELDFLEPFKGMIVISHGDGPSSWPARPRRRSDTRAQSLISRMPCFCRRSGYRPELALGQSPTRTVHCSDAGRRDRPARRPACGWSKATVFRIQLGIRRGPDWRHPLVGGITKLGSDAAMSVVSPEFLGLVPGCLASQSD